MRPEKTFMLTVLALAILVAPPVIHAAERGKPATTPPAAPPAVNNAVLAEQESGQAVTAYQAGDYQRAAEHFKRVVQLDPSNVKAWLFLGQSLAQSDDNMGARRAFAKVLALQSGGLVADRARDQLAKLPDPDLFKMQLGSGLTLGDWLPAAQQQAAQGKREEVISEIGQHLKQFGPVPQLLALQEKLQQEVQAEQEQRLKTAIDAIKVKDAESAKTALPQIRQLKEQAPSSLILLKLEARACHLMQDFTCAETSYSAWLKAAPGNDPKRKGVVEALMQARQHEALPAMPQAGTVFRDCPDCPEMVVIPEGSFDMGKTDAKYTVTFAQPFAIGKTEVTRGQFASFVNETNYNAGDKCFVFEGREWEKRSGRNWRNPGFQQDDSHPVTCISWNDAKAYVEWLSKKTGKSYHLPSESQWEYACRAGGHQEYCGGDNVDSVAWYEKNSNSTTHPVAQKQANTWELYDMSGNVREWVEDAYHQNYTGAPTDGSAWQGDGEYRVLRGGSWINVAQLTRAADRNYNDPGVRFSNFGFRLARTLP